MQLDGGNVMRSTPDAMMKGRGEKPARIVSIVMCGRYARPRVKSLWIVGILGVIFGMSNFRAS